MLLDYEIFVEMTLLVDDISQPAQDLTNKVVNEVTLLLSLDA